MAGMHADASGRLAWRSCRNLSCESRTHSRACGPRFSIAPVASRVSGISETLNSANFSDDEPEFRHRTIVSIFYGFDAWSDCVLRYYSFKFFPGEDFFYFAFVFVRTLLCALHLFSV